MVQQNLQGEQAVFGFIVQNAIVFFDNKGNALSADAVVFVVAHMSLKR